MEFQIEILKFRIIQDVKDNDRFIKIEGTGKLEDKKVWFKTTIFQPVAVIKDQIVFVNINNRKQKYQLLSVKVTDGYTEYYEDGYGMKHPVHFPGKQYLICEKI